ncbi:Integral membrane protein OS=Tsukamurella paurometabola (strain ATCC 8368 / DSM / CCUG 35730/ CIP 100753 / JCM 10117 / KCTC 9821 / NBRC 16120 / NCIMB 702349/ NCTC 13040) OX=521096 GN=Tpau_1992 PE=4 SV=1 [Tsukamurella paurometabola]|uniref:Uncharacterized protein n=1 Tax=Tsukamurella paurometabola (strain ATCC 8368 / DSM 20162 / CCUG 35730 / CIP 100753 / JCM 10117 / KCTC 9821 / NBRC 16120 / NCIMB 702349 / NCTC 13040) TaxID=521096 RepID=D5UNN6_TSUPD|nr:hypothetical protein [Tsukamurella paurometabola]ADG78604.1 hypothetical protein Tpau_1992 [Tsukamurella paurometabola DSM 20162]SUP32381.1 Uncharacterised protein [Tsukamurella paurometabola]
MNNITLTLIIILAVGWVIFRQFQARPIKDKTAKIALVLAAVGLVQTVQYVSGGGEVGIGHAVAALLGLALAVGLAYPRALTTKVFPGPDGRYLRQATLATLGLWVVAIGAHFAIDILVPAIFHDHTGRGFAGVTTMLFVGVTLYAQYSFLQRRVDAHRVQQPLQTV